MSINGAGPGARASSNTQISNQSPTMSSTMSSTMCSMPTITVDPAVPASVREAAAAAKEVKEAIEKLGRLDKKINDTVAQIQRAMGALFGGIVCGPEANGPADAFGALEGDLIDAEALEEKLNELQKERSDLKSQEHKLIRELRGARLEMRKVPFEELMSVVKSEKSTKEEYEAAEAEMRRREMVCLVIRHILGGGYWMPHKDRKYCVYRWFGSAAGEVRNESIVEIARFGFGEEDAKTMGAVVCQMLGRPDSDGSDVALTEVCWLSAKYGPQFVRLEDYQKLMVESKANVDLIFGTALKAKLRSIDPKHWDFCEDSEDSVDGAIAKRPRA